MNKIHYIPFLPQQYMQCMNYNSQILIGVWVFLIIHNENFSYFIHWHTWLLLKFIFYLNNNFKYYFCRVSVYVTFKQTIYFIINKMKVLIMTDKLETHYWKVLEKGYLRFFYL